ncbi:hypothetical protein RRG08_014623 [Elysia crispata]|uniref:Uncharacterized protein n=1 Tax=Elysia crispata TaxID=231223 RepID=A0AAE0YRT1_9GAST|nr:hypothetical protein RRG08_014623 [Elysia crispata]
MLQIMTSIDLFIRINLVLSQFPNRKTGRRREDNSDRPREGRQLRQAKGGHNFVKNLMFSLLTEKLARVGWF